VAGAVRNELVLFVAGEVPAGELAGVALSVVGVGGEGPDPAELVRGHDGASVVAEPGEHGHVLGTERDPAGALAGRNVPQRHLAAACHHDPRTVRGELQADDGRVGRSEIDRFRLTASSIDAATEGQD
jgi:hypothetical protein